MIEAEFLFLGILRADGHAVLRWLDHKVTASDLSDEISRHISKAPRISTAADLPLSDEAERILGYAEEEAKALSHSHIGSEHLFLGLLRDPQSRIVKILFERGIDPKTVRENIVKEGTQPK